MIMLRNLESMSIMREFKNYMSSIITTNKNKANFLVLFSESYLAYLCDFSYIESCCFL